MTFTIETDDRSRVVLPGYSNQRFIVRENEDGSLLLQPARVITDAQYAYDTDADLQAMLSQAASEPTVRRPRRKPRAT